MMTTFLVEEKKLVCFVSKGKIRCLQNNSKKSLFRSWLWNEIGYGARFRLVHFDFRNFKHAQLKLMNIYSKGLINEYIFQRVLINLTKLVLYLYMVINPS